MYKSLAQFTAGITNKRTAIRPHFVNEVAAYKQVREGRSGVVEKAQPYNPAGRGTD
jgi:hypothetical protein